ncbi:MAG: TIGR02757 family protein [Rikenellaceae bacterium]
MNTQLNKELLDELHYRFNNVDFIADDPISIPHSFTAREDIEISGFLAATIAWGNRKAIVKSARRMMEFLDNAPYDFVVNHSEAELLTLQKYVHRTFNGGDFTDFIRALKGICQKHKSLGEYFQGEYRRCGSIPLVISQFRSDFFSAEHSPRCEKHLSSIDKGSACKRVNMYLRWMVRHDDNGVDFGLWSDIPSSALYLPLDVHSGNVARHLGLLTRKQSDWRAVAEVTENLRQFDVNDPVKYDFALFGAGISGLIKP